MEFVNSTTNNHISLQVSNVKLPNDSEEREHLLQEINEAVKQVLAANSIEDPRPSAYSGHTYAQIPFRCPFCDEVEGFRLFNPELGPENAARATAYCDCGWYGEAQYRLIDFVEEGIDHGEEHSPPSDDEITVEDYFPPSCVKWYGIRPEYVPY